MTADAQITRIEILSRAPASEPSGTGGAYELIAGRAHGEVDPSDRRNIIIQDLALAPRNSRGRVEYAATFKMAKPVHMTKASGVLMYSVVNRGNGDVVPSAEGHTWLVSGWQGDVVPTTANQTIQVPAARNANGSAITGPALLRFTNIASGTNTISLRGGGRGAAAPSYPQTAADQADAVLTMATGESAMGVKTGASRVPRAEWAFADCRTTPFPGVPDPSRLCVKAGFDPARLYELVYNVRDPLVLGLGLAATRDLVSFFRHASADSNGSPNPVAGAITHVVSFGNSQSGNFIKTFIHPGFNEDTSGRIVWDGAFPRIAGRQTPMNFRFALPGGAATLYEPGSEPVLWWSTYEDAARKRPAASLLDRCTSTRTCPKIVEAFGATEFWGLRMSPGLIGTDAKRDIPLPDNVRRYYYPGTTHGGGRGGFGIAPTDGSPASCSLPGNPNPEAEQTRALTADLVDWVVRGTPPPASRYPLLAKGELVPATRAAMGFPNVPGLPFRDGLVNGVLDYDFGPAFLANDLSGIIRALPPRITQVIPTYVPRVDTDGNETSGVPSVLHQAPLGTYLGWNVTASGFDKDRICGFSGGYVPFARTKAERAKAGDPRPSVEERYGTLEGYLCVVRQAVDQAVADRFLLRDDAGQMMAAAEKSGVLPPDSASSPAARAIARNACAAPRR